MTGHGRGYGNDQINLLNLTVIKIIQTLAVRPYTYEELRGVTRIQRNSLKSRLELLVSKGIVIKHKHNPLRILHTAHVDEDKFSNNSQHNTTKARYYYVLNLNNFITRKTLLMHKPDYMYKDGIEIQNKFSDPNSLYSKRSDWYKQRIINYTNILKNAIDSIEFADQPSLYYVEQNETKISESINTDQRQLTAFLHKDQRARKSFHQITKDEIIQTNFDKLQLMFQEKEKQEQRILDESRQLVTDIILLTNICVGEYGYSTLDILIHECCTHESNRRMYKLLWDALNQSGFLAKYEFNS
jgi:hypothetical protein